MAIQIARKLIEQNHQSNAAMRRFHPVVKFSGDRPLHISAKPMANLIVRIVTFTELQLQARHRVILPVGITTNHIANRFLLRRTIAIR